MEIDGICGWDGEESQKLQRLKVHSLGINIHISEVSFPLSFKYNNDSPKASKTT